MAKRKQDASWAMEREYTGRGYKVGLQAREYPLLLECNLGLLRNVHASCVRAIACARMKKSALTRFEFPPPRAR